MAIEFKHIDHITIPVPPDQLEAAEQFYTHVLGLTPKVVPEALRVRGFRWYDIAGLELHVGPEENFHASTRHPAFVIADLKQARHDLSEQGVRIKETVPLPDRDRFFVYDPFGNRIELIEYY